MNYGIVIFPGSEIQDYANSLRKRYDPQYALIPPHMKLKEAFHIDDQEVDRYVSLIKEVTDQSKPFTLHFHKFGHFSPTNNVIYMAVNNKDDIHDLHSKLHEGDLGQFTPKYEFVPHLTIGQSMADDELHDVYAGLRMKDIDFKAHVDRIHLMYKLEDGMWTVYHTFLLGQQNE